MLLRLCWRDEGKIPVVLLCVTVCVYAGLVQRQTLCQMMLVIKTCKRNKHIKTNNGATKETFI